MALCTTTPHLVHFKCLKFIVYDLTVGSFKKGKSNGYWALFKKVYVPIFELFQKLCELFPCIVKLPAAPLEKKYCQSDAI